jgi:O-acetyl-ADP-ribose deacetylase
MAGFRVVRGDITTLVVDVIVNAANAGLLGGGGVDGAIHRAAGPRLLEECRAVVARQGRCDPGDAVMTGAGDLAASHVIHTVGPVFVAERADELDAVLGRCYTSSMRLADAHGAASIAFPCISTGVYRYPRARAAPIAVAAVRQYVASTPRSSLTDVAFVCFDDENAQLYEQLLA